MSKTTEDKTVRIKEIFRRQEELQAELETLLNPEKQVILPVGFSINIEILRVIKESGEAGIDPKKLLAILRTQFPQYGIDRRKIASSLAYLKNRKKQIALVGKGVYKAADEV
jgi:hypothetical protein